MVLDINAPRLTLSELVRQRKIFTLEMAAKAADYNAQHLRRLCAAKKVKHTRRGGQDRTGRYYFTAAQMRSLFKYHG